MSIAPTARYSGSPRPQQGLGSSIQTGGPGPPLPLLGMCAFGTQLLCEQVVGRALRRQSYEPDAEGRFPVECADVLGVPFDFASQPQPATQTKPVNPVAVRAV